METRNECCFANILKVIDVLQRNAEKCEMVEENNTSSVFRVEKVNDCCVTVRILAPNPVVDEARRYISTNQFAKINLECVCVLQCLPDTIVENI